MKKGWLVMVFLGAAGCGVVDPNRDGSVRELTAMTFDAGRYVAVGVVSRVMDDALVPGSDTVLIQISDDGRNWRDVSPPVAGSLTGVAFGAGRFVAVGTFWHANGVGPQETDPVVLTSEDGVTWKALADPPNRRWRSVTFGNGRFVATGTDRNTLLDEILVSDDGVEWADLNVTDILSTAVTFGNGVFVLWGESNTIGVSVDGETWDVVTADAVNRIADIAFLDGRFVGTGDFDCCFGEVAGGRTIYTLESTAGRAWTVREQGLGQLFFGHAFGNGRFVATGSRVIAAADGSLTWSVVADFDDFVSDIAYGDGVFVSVGRVIRVSEDGLEWDRVSLGEPLDGS